jgi:hypothetical protein
MPEIQAVNSLSVNWQSNKKQNQSMGTEINFPERSGVAKPESTRRYNLRRGLEWQSLKVHSGTTSGVVWRGKARKCTAVQPSERSGVAKPESARRYNFRRGPEWQSLKAHSGTTFGEVWSGKARKCMAVQPSERSEVAKPESAWRYNFRGGLEGQSPSSCAAGATLPHLKPSKFPAQNAPERAVVVTMR